jgi:osmotically-inducible protein OsmY
MKTNTLIRAFAAIALIASVGAFAGCTTSSNTTETTGQYVDDATITTKVKSAILAEPGLKTMQIGVETYKNVVQLSGFVDNDQTRTRAADVAAKIPGVKSVRNDLVTK